MENIIKTYTSTEIPEGYIKVNPCISLKQNRSMTMTSSGLVKINNCLNYDTTTKKSYSDIEIFFSQEKNRYFITSIYQKVFTLSDIKETTRKTPKVTAKDVIGIFGLNPDEFEFTKFGGIEKVKDEKQTIFYTVKKTKRNWDCLNYVIID